MPRSRYRIYDNAYPHFLTCTIVGWLPVFTRAEMFQIVYDSWTWLAANRDFKVFAYVILENHLHLVAASPQLAKDVASFKSYTARSIVDWLTERQVKTLLRQFKREKAAHKTDREHQVWHEGSHPQQIDGEPMMWQKIEYIHNNPVVRTFVDDPLHWRHSSARNYAGQPGLFPVDLGWR